MVPAVTLHVARHAHAGQRSAWSGDDRFRPLSARGLAQSAGIADRLAEDPPERILSSPAVRCVQTVTPLAVRLGLHVEIENRLFEGSGRTSAAALLDEVATTPIVLCSHGDVVPHLLEELVGLGMVPARDLVWQKASIWSVEMSPSGRPGAGRYLPPPDRA